MRYRSDMGKRIDDEIAGLAISRSLKWRRRKYRDGKCITSACLGKPIRRGYCADCLIKAYRENRAKRGFKRVNRCKAQQLIAQATTESSEG